MCPVWSLLGRESDHEYLALYCLFVSGCTSARTVATDKGSKSSIVIFCWVEARRKRVGGFIGGMFRQWLTVDGHDSCTCTLFSSARQAPLQEDNNSLQDSSLFTIFGLLL